MGLNIEATAISYTWLKSCEKKEKRKGQTTQ